MSFTNWLSRRLRLSAQRLGPTSRPASKRRTRSPQRTFKPCLEGLEDRLAPAVVTVNTTADDPNGPTTGQTTLRDAINYANSNPGTTINVGTTINFNIPTSDPNYNSTTQSFTMQLTSALPALRGSGTIVDGYSQPGASPNTLPTGDDAHLAIVLSGVQNSASLNGDGLIITGGNCVVDGLDIINWAHGFGIWVASVGNLILGNFVGTDVTGEHAMPNGYQNTEGGTGAGIRVDGSNNLIGQVGQRDRNVVSGNGAPPGYTGTTYQILLNSGSNNVVQGNFIGTDKNGTQTPTGADESDGIKIMPHCDNNTIGGTKPGNGSGPGSGNVISGIDGYGINIDTCAGIIVQSNRIGTNAAGVGAVPNSGDGILVYNPTGRETIGGLYFGTQTTDNIGVPVYGGGNLISGNSGWGINDGGGTSSTGDLVQGNIIGRDITNYGLLPNGAGGMRFVSTPGPVIGGVAPATYAGYANNIAAVNKDAIDFLGGVSNARIQGNSIYAVNTLGTSYSSGYGDGIGVDLVGTGNNNNLIGTLDKIANTISLNLSPSSIYAQASTGNVISTNTSAVLIQSGNTGNSVLGNDLLTGTPAVQLAGTGNNGLLPPTVNSGTIMPLLDQNGNLQFDQAGKLATESQYTGTVSGNSLYSYILELDLNSTGFPQLVVPGNPNGLSPVYNLVGGGQPFTMTLPSDEAITVNETKVIPNGSYEQPGDSSEYSPAARAYWTSDSLQTLIDKATAEGITSLTFPSSLYDQNGVPVFDNDSIQNLLQGLTNLTSRGYTASAHITLNVYLGPWTYGDLSGSAPYNVRLNIYGSGSSTPTKVIGQSPALTLSSGDLVINNVQFTTATDAPTVLVTGGHLTLRNCDVEESTGYADAAIAVTGGTVDLGTAASPGNNIINVNGAGQLLLNTTSQPISIVGDTFEANGVVIPSPFQSTTTLTSSANPSLLHQTITLMTSVTASAVSGTPTGNVDFVDTTTNTDLGTVALSGGMANLALSSLSVGNHVIVAKYSGDVTFSTSTGQLTQAVHYNFSGFLGPLHANGTYQLGRTLPIAFQLTDYYGNYISDLSAVSALQIQSVNAQGQPQGPPTNPKGAGNTQLRYDTTDNQFLFNWDTKGLSAGYFDIVLTLADGTQQKLMVQLR